METLQSSHIYPAFGSRGTGVCIVCRKVPSVKGKAGNSGFWTAAWRYTSEAKVQTLCVRQYLRSITAVRCRTSSSSDDNGTMAENFSECNEDYVNSSVIEADEVQSAPEGFLIKLHDGRQLRCVPNSPKVGQIQTYTSHSAIVLKIEDGSDLLIPIIVWEMSSALLMAAVQNVEIARPSVYQIVKDLIEKMEYTVQLIRVTKRVHDVYFAELHIAKIGDNMESITFDLRPSDAINIAVRCKVPIEVNKLLAYSDGMRVVEPAMLGGQGIEFDDLSSELDRPDGQPCMQSKEFYLIRNMLIAAVEERYSDAAEYRDSLFKLRFE